MKAMIRATLLAVLTAFASLAQTASSVSLSNGVQLRISAAFGQQPWKIIIGAASGNSIYRVFQDENGLAIFAYELALERTPDGEQMRVTARPATAEFARRFPSADGGKPTPTLSDARELPLLRSGERAAIEIFTAPLTGDKVIDTLEVRIGRGAPLTNATATAGARLRLAAVRVYINRSLASPPGPGAVVTGRYAMFYIPGQGGYFLSLDAPEGREFTKAGWVDGPRMQFTIDNQTYDCVAEAPFLAAGGRGEIWVYHDPNYLPAGNWTASGPTPGDKPEFFAAASDTLSWWLPK
jgi:hypothetical protein